MEDKELDDLLDSALEDFDKKIPLPPTPSIITTTNQKSTINIEKTNLYVDDIDYDDRPAPTSLSNNKKGLATNSASSGPQIPNFSSLLFNPSGDKNKGSSSKNNIEDDMKMFEDIFGDAKTKESMKHLKDTLSMFKEGDEHKLLENFDKVMSQITDTFNIDDDGEDGLENDENEAEALKSFTKMMTQMNMNKGETEAKKEDDSVGGRKKGEETASNLNSASFF